MAQAIDIGSAVLLHKRLAYGALASGAAIYLEALLVFVLIEEDAVVPVVLVPALCIVGAQYLAIRKPVRLLVADAQGQPPPQLPSRVQPPDAGVPETFRGGGDRPGGPRADQPTSTGSRLARACRIHLILQAAFVALLWVAAENEEARIVAPATAALVLGLVTVWPVAQMMRTAIAVVPVIRAVGDARVLLDCFSADVRRSLTLTLQSAGGRRARWLAPWLISAVAVIVAALGTALAMRLLDLTTGPVGIIAGMVGVAVYYRMVRRTKLHAAELREADRRPPVLFLRQFRDDTLSTLRFSLGERPTFEHLAAATLARMGPPISIGRPGERLQPLGAAREYLTDPDWQRAVERLIRDAGVVVIVLGDSESLLWEVRTALTARGTAGVLVLVPPIRDRHALEQRWARFRDSVADLVDEIGPMPPRRVLAMCFAGREPVFITCKERAARQALAYRTDPDYRLALRLFEHLNREALQSTASLAAWLARYFPLAAVEPAFVVSGRHR